LRPRPHDGSGFAVAETRLIVDGAVVADAEIVMIITDFPSSGLKAAFLDRSLRIRDPTVARA
jgi:hypothetical protein